MEPSVAYQPGARSKEGQRQLVSSDGSSACWTAVCSAFRAPRPSDKTNSRYMVQTIVCFSLNKSSN